MNSPRKQAIKEVNRELSQRKRVYPRLIQSEKLHKDRANAQYKQLRDLGRMLEMMTDAQYNDYLARWARRQATTPQPTLF